jgi:AcrR family transcriptional regulator
MQKEARSPARRRSDDEEAVRTRILDAAFGAFMEQGYADTSTLEIATRAKVSKRELYALVGAKHELLLECIQKAARRMALPADLGVAHDRESLAARLTALGAQLLGEVTDPKVVATFRLAIAESARAPEVARALDEIGRKAWRETLLAVMSDARSAGLLGGEPREMAEQFGALLWGNQMVNLLLRLVETPTQQEAASRAATAAEAVMRLYPPTEG